MVSAVLTLVIIIASVGSQLMVSALSCLAEDGQPVDWFVLYKMPATESQEISTGSFRGESYVYRSSQSQQLSWIVSNQSIESHSSLPGQTLGPLYRHRDQKIEEMQLLLMYNDEFPNGTTSESAAHAKGVVAFDGHSGFWMLHSVPHFPPSPDAQSDYSFPTTGLKYGQAMFCVSLPFAQADLIGGQLRYYHPFVYFWQNGGHLSDSVPQLVQAATGNHIRQPPWFQNQQLMSLSGTRFISFAKSNKFNQDLYGDLVAPALKINLLTETWTNGQGTPLPSRCNVTYKVENVKEMELNDITFMSHKDHSKWAVSTRPQQPWVCIADINRMESQFKRGGGSLCFENKVLWKNFLQSIHQVENCPIDRAAKDNPTKQ